MSVHAFGVTADGHSVHAVQLAWPSGLEVQILEFGAIVRRLGFPAPEGLRQAILSYETLADYERDTAYLGALVGRFANRIAGGRFPLDGREVQVSVNELPNTLHGGVKGFNKRIWRIEDADPEGLTATLAYLSPDGEEGFPGDIDVRATYTLTAADILQIDYFATTDAPTPVNLSQHLYFNLLGDRDSKIMDYDLTVAAEYYTPVVEGLIPSGELAGVAGTPFDLRGGSKLSDVLARQNPQIAMAGGLDFNWALVAGATPAVELRAPDGARLRLSTDQPGMQIYSGQGLKPPFAQHGALVLEPQGFPDAMNHPDFPDAILRPGQTYRRRSVYRLGF